MRIFRDVPAKRETTMRVQDFVKGNVRTVSRQASIQEVARLMADEDVGFIPVVDSSGKPVGTITDRDIVVRLIAPGGELKNARVEQAMTKDLVSVRPDEDIGRVADLM